MFRNDRLRRSPCVENLEGRRLLTATTPLTAYTANGHLVHLSVTSVHQQGNKLTVKLPASEADASLVQNGDGYGSLTLGKKTYYEVVAKSVNVTGHGKAAQETINFSYITTDPKKLRH